MNESIWVMDFPNQLIREKVEKPDEEKYQDVKLGTKPKYYRDLEKYEQHLASRRTFSYPVSKEQDGKKLREGVDFEIKTRSAKYKCPRCRHTFKEKQDHGCMDGQKLIYEIEWEEILPVAIPIDIGQTDRQYEEGLPEQPAEETPVQLMDKAVKCLYLELPVEIADNIFYKWNAAKEFLYSSVSDPASKDELTIEDYKEVFEDHKRLVRELDFIINGENAAKQASLCDIVAQLQKEYKGKEQENDAIGFAEWMAEKIGHRKIGWIKDWNTWRNWGVQEVSGEPAYSTTEQLYKEYKLKP